MEIDKKIFIYKFFGEKENIISQIEKLKNQYLGVEFNITSDNFDNKLLVEVDNNFQISHIESLQEEIVKVLGESLYSDEDLTLSETLFKILKEKNLKISIGESFTGGRVSSELVKNSGISNYFLEGIVAYSNESKHNRLKVKSESLLKYGAVSKEVAYEMCLGLLNNGADLVISTTGLAGPNGDDFNNPVGTFFIGVGDKKSIHIFKYCHNGSREEITEIGKNTALYLSILNFKNI